MITNGKKWCYLAIKNVHTTNGYKFPVIILSRLFCRITSNHMGDFYCFGCFHSFCMNNNLKNMKDYVLNMIPVM